MHAHTSLAAIANRTYAYKYGKCIFVGIHPLQNPEKVAPIVQSLSCK